MAWSWSYTAEGLDLIRRGIERMSVEDLRVAFAEHAAYRERNHPAVRDEFNKAAYRRALKLAERLAGDTLADAVMEGAEEVATCSNGAWEAWACPYGCHTVDLDEEEAAQCG